jgi:iron complex transport system substrate-binding protein
MNPSLTETLVALDAAGVLVGVDEYSARLEPAVKGVPVVGGLFNPSLEAVVALTPDLVVLVPGAEQRSVAERLTALGVPVLLLPNITLEQALASIETLGSRVDRVEAARRRVDEIRATWREVRRASAKRPPIPTVLVLQRDPLYVVGPGSFIDEMLRAAGARNLASALKDPYPQAGVEWLIDVAPRVILDATEDPETPERYWARWPSIPAVAASGAVAIRPDVMRPGPWIDKSLRAVAAALERATSRAAR